MADQQTHTRWTKNTAPGDPREHVAVSTDGNGNWSVVHSVTFNSAITAMAWAKGIVEREAWVDYNSDA